jgi:hypothetical protein
MPITQDFSYPSISEIRYKDLRFIITDSPDDENVQLFTEVYIKKKLNNAFFIIIIFFYRLV